MNVLDRIYREPAAALALVGAVLTVLTAIGLLDETGAAVALGVVTAGIGALRYVVTPAVDVIAKAQPDGTAVAGAATDVLTGHRVDVDVQPVPTDLT